jgi:zinc and cadmium transporter
MSSTLLLVVYCLLILAASLVGGWLPIVVRLTHRRLQLAVSLVAGVMLGVALLHLLPHALIEAPGKVDAVFNSVLVGFLVMFFLERFFCFHHHDVPHSPEKKGAPGEKGALEKKGASGEQVAVEEDHGDHPENCPHLRSDSHRLTWSGAAVGLTLHTIIAGIALAASVEAESRGNFVASSAAGLGTFLVIFLHKPFDAMTISTLMTVGGWSITSRHVVNGLFALMIPVGVGLFQLGLGHSHADGNLVAYALAFSAGTFVCVALSDLLPELQFHAHDRGLLSFFLVLGLSIAWAIGLAESAGHDHGHQGQSPSVDAHDHDAELDQGHDHNAEPDQGHDHDAEPDHGHEH